MKKSHQHTRSSANFPIFAVSLYSQFTPAEVFDLRCEYEVPRFLDLNHLEYDSKGYDIKYNQSITQEDEFFQWFQIPHDFKVNRKMVNATKDQVVKYLPPKMPQKSTTKLQQKKTSTMVNNISLSSNATSIPNETTKITETQQSLNSVKNSGSQTDRNIMSSKNRTSRNQLNRTKSQIMQNGISKQTNASMKSLDLNPNLSHSNSNTNPNLHQNHSSNAKSNQNKPTQNNQGNNNQLSSSQIVIQSVPQQQIFQKTQRLHHQQAKSQIDNIMIDLTTVNTNGSTSTTTTQNVKSISAANSAIATNMIVKKQKQQVQIQQQIQTQAKMQYQERIGNQTSRERQQSRTALSKSRVDFISQNKERVKLISASSKTRKQSAHHNNSLTQNNQSQGSAGNNHNNMVYFQNVIMEENQNGNKVGLSQTKSISQLMRQKAQVSHQSSTNHQSNTILATATSTASRNAKMTIKSAKQHTSRDLSKMDHTTLTANLSAMLKEPSSVKRKRNGRVNSLMWGGCASSSGNLMNATSANMTLNYGLSAQGGLNQQPSYQKISEIDLSSSNQPYTTRGDINNPAIMQNEKENLIQSQYLKQLLKMQQKYQHSRGHQRNQLSQSGISGKSLLYNEKNSNSQTSLSKNKVTSSFSKLGSSGALNETANAKNNYHSKKPSINGYSGLAGIAGGSSSQRDPLISSHVNLNNL